MTALICAHLRAQRIALDTVSRLLVVVGFVPSMIQSAELFRRWPRRLSPALRV